MKQKKIYAVGCFVEHKDKFLILLRNSAKHEADTWGLPGGAIKLGENKEQAIKRKLYGEIGLNISNYDCSYVGEFVLNYKEMITFFSTYRLKIEDIDSLELKIDCREHKKFKWVTPHECYAMDNCMSGVYTLLEKIYLVE